MSRRNTCSSFWPSTFKYHKHIIFLVSNSILNTIQNVNLYRSKFLLNVFLYVGCYFCLWQRLSICTEYDPWGLLKITLDMVVHLKFSKGYKLFSDCFIQFFQLYILITGFVTRLIRRVPLVEQELLILPEHPVFSGVRVTRSLVLCICFVDRCLFFFSFGNCVVCSYSIYGFG